MANVGMTYSLYDCTCNHNESTLVTGVDYEFIVTAKNGYMFNTAPTLQILMSTTTNFVKQSDTVYSLSFRFTTSHKNATINGYTVEKPVIKEYDYNFTTNQLNHCTTNILPSKNYHLTQNDTLRITVTADENYYFADYPFLGIYSSGGQYTKFAMTPVDTTSEFPTEFYTNLKPKDEYETTFNIGGNATVIPADDKYGIINMYNPTSKELKAIGDVRYSRQEGDTTILIDLGNYISNLIKVFVNIPQNNKAIIMLGGYSTKVESNVITNDIVETDCGNIDIVGNYNNSMDYEQTEVEIYLPFIGFQKLDTRKVMNETLHLMYRTNIINGDSIACLYDTIGTLLYTFNCSVAFEVPYRINDDIDNTNRISIDSNYLFGFTPFVTIRYNKNYNSANVITNDDKYCKIGDLKGLVNCSAIFNTIRATNNEKTEIDNLLKNGIIV